MIQKRKIKGFTLVELMLVVAIVSLLAAIATPKFANMIIKAKEASVKAQLGALRSSFSIYFADNEGLFPEVDPITRVNSLSILLVPKYIKEIPSITIPTVSDHTHPRSNTTFFSDFPKDDSWGFEKAREGWFGEIIIDAFLAQRFTGQITVNCTHPDSQGRIWSTW